MAKLDKSKLFGGLSAGDLMTLASAAELPELEALYQEESVKFRQLETAFLEGGQKLGEAMRVKTAKDLLNRRKMQVDFAANCMFYCLNTLKLNPIIPEDLDNESPSELSDKLD